MGKDKRQQLTQLLAFIKELYDHPDNKEFAAGIRDLVLNDESFTKGIGASAMRGDPEAIRKIEAYLSLDFRIDAKNLEDYSFIKDESVRERLQADYREMLRYQFGTRNHKIDFPEFCRFAVLQIEMLTNYYFNMRYGSDIGEITRVFMSSFPSFKPYAGMTNVSEIQLKTKLYQIRNEFSWERKDLNTFIYAIDVRNNQSHRSLLINKDLIRETEEKLKQAGAMTSYGRPDYRLAVNVVGNDTLNKYNFQIWLERQPFDEVISAIKKLSEAIANNLSGTH